MRGTGSPAGPLAALGAVVAVGSLWLQWASVEAIVGVPASRHSYDGWELLLRLDVLVVVCAVATLALGLASAQEGLARLVPVATAAAAATAGATTATVVIAPFGGGDVGLGPYVAIAGAALTAAGAGLGAWESMRQAAALERLRATVR